MRVPGKNMGYLYYVHRSAIKASALPDDIVSEARKKVPRGFKYTIIRWHRHHNHVSFTCSPDFNEAHEPVVGDAYLVRADGTTRLTRQKRNPQIYHHKWMFVPDTYCGFDVEVSKMRTKLWTALNPNRALIGYKSYWEQEVVPLIRAL